MREWPKNRLLINSMTTTRRGKNKLRACEQKTWETLLLSKHCVSMFLQWQIDFCAVRGLWGWGVVSLQMTMPDIAQVFDLCRESMS